MGIAPQPSARETHMKSFVSIAAGLLLIVFLAVVTDTTLQYMGVLPITGKERFTDRHSLLALSYHLLYAALGAYVTARLAPRRPLIHALALGSIGLVMSVLGLQAIIERNLTPAWYGWALILLALPVTWLGGYVVVARQQSRRRRDGPHVTPSV